MLAQAVAAIALGLMATSGVAKFVDPDPTTGAMRAARLPASTPVTYALGVIESTVAVLALVVGGPAVLAGALLYGGFTIFTLAATLYDFPIQSCGCFGRADTPPSRLHVVFNLMATLALGRLAILGMGPIDWSLPAMDLVLFLGFAIAGVFASYLLLAQLPQVTTRRA
ncbi:MAG: MauE/DoxX family redox-associated membrane protein [Acidimicrobiia bacterium]